MIPIQNLLQRIQWDPQFGAARFTVGYYDRRLQRLVRIPFQRLQLESGKHFSFDVVDSQGNVRMVPFHRVRAVWRENELIWQRRGGPHETDQEETDLPFR